MRISARLRPGRASLLALGALVAFCGSAAPAQTGSAHARERIVLAGGCFWGMEAVFERLKGVSSVTAGFAGGASSTAHYEMVSTGTTGHAESVEVVYDPSRISFERLLAVYFTVAHDPTQLDRQGPDDGPQYRSEIFYTTEVQHRIAAAYIHKLEAEHTFSQPIVTKVARLGGFYAAEAYHQHFVDKNPQNPYVVENDLPKLQHLRQRFPDLVKAGA